MRIRDAICSFALLTLGTGSMANASPVDPTNDFDCATAFQFAHRMAVAKQLEADLQEQTLIMNAWFAEKWDYEHPGEGPNQFDHYSEILKILPDDPAATVQTLKACSARANADPRFGGFVTAFRKNPPKPR
jgi:hypothetical protein